jgi:hypothetical protein
MTAAQKQARERFKKAAAAIKAMRKKNSRLSQVQATKQYWKNKKSGRKVSGTKKKPVLFCARKTKRKRVSGIKSNSDRMDRKRVNITIGAVGDRTVVYRGFVIVGKKYFGHGRYLKRGKAVTPRTLWYLTDGNGNVKSGAFVSLTTAKAWIRHLSK